MVRCADKKAANTCFRHDQDHLAHHGREAAKKALTDIRYHIGMLSRRYGDSQVGASKYVMHFTGFPVNDLQVCSDINGAVIPAHSRAYRDEDLHLRRGLAGRNQPAVTSTAIACLEI
jgi:hypothetical protein